MSKYFGKTWWGEQWLNSLTHIDYDNRLPRGSAYAKKGAVRDIVIDQNMIHAKVQGSRIKPYKVTIVVPPFFDDDVRILIKAIAQKPLIISKLLNRELDPEVLGIAEKKGLKIFPRQWNDFKMVCDCPDWAVPCKHLASVIYKVSAEIDNNPFLVFDLHRVDLIQALKKERIFISSENATPPLLSDLLSKTEPRERAYSTDEVKPDYSSLYPISDALIKLLANAPVFYQEAGNFRDKYTMHLKRVERSAQKVLMGKITLEAHANGVKTAYKALITPHTQIDITPDGKGEATLLVDGKKSKWSIPLLLGELDKIPLHLAANYQPSIETFRILYQLCLNLAANGAIIPQIVKLDSGMYAVRWLPALICNEVKQVMEGFYRQTDRIKAEHKGLTNDVAVLVSPFLTALVEMLTGKPANDIFLDLFFYRKIYPFRMPGEEALPGGVHSWLQRYFIAKGTHKPSLMINELLFDKFRIDVNLELNSEKKKERIPLHEVLNNNAYEQQRYEILQSLAHLTHFVPQLGEFINSEGAKEIVLDMTQFTPFLMEIIPAIRLLDISIFLPKSLQQLLRPKASVRIKKKGKDGKSFVRLDELLDYDWQVAVGDTLINESEFSKLLHSSAGLIRFKSSYIYASPDDLAKLYKQFSSTKKMSPLEILRTVLSEEYRGATIAIDNEVRELIHELTQQPDVPLPEGLKAQLRPYQQRGFSWMYRNAQIGFGSVLADDMGLGKTLQVITTLLKYKEEGALDAAKALIVSPTGLLTNWQAEFERFAPSLNVQLYHGTNRQINPKNDSDVWLTSYGMIRSDIDLLKKKKWHVVVIDEAQNIKNQDTAQSKAIKSLKATTHIAMSGTPVENRLSELWSIMDFSNRGFLGSITDFKEAFGDPIQSQNDFAAAHRLKQVTTPFMMRRLKSDKHIISDLPDKIEIDSFGYLAKGQAALYEETLQEAMRQIEDVEGTDHKSLFARQGLVLQMILALKQICNHPTQFLKNDIMDASLSGKMDLLFERLDTIMEANEKVLIFTQFTEMGNMLKLFIAERYGEVPMFYHGGCSIKQRQDMVDRFQQNRADKIFILSLKAAGTGLNLTAANHVIHYDLWWNPAVEAQATDRAYRIGQKSNVMVHRFITKGTFEERINDMIQSKKALAEMTVATGENWIGNLNNNELRDLFKLK